VTIKARRSPWRAFDYSVVPVTPSTAICSGLPVALGPAHPLSHGHQSRGGSPGRRSPARSIRDVVRRLSWYWPRF